MLDFVRGMGFGVLGHVDRGAAVLGFIGQPRRLRLAEAGRNVRRVWAVAYDEDIEARVRELLAGQTGVTEKKMFGGLAFLVGGNMAVAASGQGGLLVRVDPAESDALIKTTKARFMEMRGAPMRGWLRVGPEDVRTNDQLAEWVRLGTGYARSLPSKG